MPIISLVASTYRSERFLPAWLESIETQTLWPDAELVVVANDPQPAEDELLRDFSGRHSQVRVLTVDREPLYRSWNRAIDASTGPLLAIANVDDLRTRPSLEAQVSAMEADPAALFCYGTFAIVREFPPPTRAARIVHAEAFDRERFTRGMLLGPFFVWRRKPGPATAYFDEQLRVGGDFDLAIRLALHGTGLCVDETLGFYYDGAMGLSTSGEAQAIERTVLELRYGIYDKIDYRYVPQAAEFVIPQLLQPDGSWLPVADVVPDYAQFLWGRRERWFRPPRRPLFRLPGRS